VTKHKPPQHEAEPAKPSAENAADTKPRPAVAPTAPQAETASDVDESLAQLRAELETAKDRELRCRAELDNYRKRAAREREEMLRYANMSLLRDLLPVLDNVDRAIQAAQQNADAGALLDGFKMVQQQMQEVLTRHHCRQIEALHAPFDPNVHHAVMQQPSDEHPANTVLMVTQDGYQLHDRVVRPSQVIVSKAQ
jgi:molecular chaperone GrpE